MFSTNAIHDIPIAGRTGDLFQNSVVRNQPLKPPYKPAYVVIPAPMMLDRKPTSCLDIMPGFLPVRKNFVLVHLISSTPCTLPIILHPLLDYVCWYLARYM